MMCRLFLVALLGLAACAPSPLYVSSNSSKHRIAGEVPRDGQGEPIWSAIHPIPVPAGSSQPPPMPLSSVPQQ